MDAQFRSDLAFIAELAAEDDNRAVQTLAHAHLRSLDLPAHRTLSRRKRARDRAEYAALRF